MKQIINSILSGLHPLDDAALASIKDALWKVVPQALKDHSIKNSALIEALNGEGARYCPDTETAVLSRVLAYPHIALPYCSSITTAHFYEPGNQLIWMAIAFLYEKGSIVSTDTVLSFINDRGLSVDMMYLDSLPSSAPKNTPYTWDGFEGLLSTLKAYAAAREVSNVCIESLEQVYKVPVEQSSGVRANLIERLASINSGGTNRVMDAAQGASKLMERYEAIRERAKAGMALAGISSGFRQIDSLTGGWQKKDLTIIAARPSMGKTALLLKKLLHAAQNGEPVLFFSLEMGRDAIIQRLFCMTQEVQFMDFNNGRLTPEQEMKLQRFIDWFSTLPFYIEDTPGVSASYIEDVVAQKIRENNITLIGIDYLQLMSHSWDKRARPIDIAGNASKGLKQIAKRFDIPVLCLSQLSRAVESRPGKKPQLADLRESGQIEQDADIVMFIYRPEYYGIVADEDGEDLKGIAKIIIAKQRNGALDTVDTFFDGQYICFKELSERPDNYSSNHSPFPPEAEDDLDWGKLGDIKF